MFYITDRFSQQTLTKTSRLRRPSLSAVIAFSLLGAWTGFFALRVLARGESIFAADLLHPDLFTVMVTILFRLEIF